VCECVCLRVCLKVGKRLTRDTLKAEEGWPREASFFERRALNRREIKAVLLRCVCVCLSVGG